MSEKLSRTGVYPSEFSFGEQGKKRYLWNGEKRPPRAGEFYLSGSKIIAYQTEGDLSYPYHIAEEVPPAEVPCPHCGRRA
jgi:hypothetical protein